MLAVRHNACTASIVLSYVFLAIYRVLDAHIGSNPMAMRPLWKGSIRFSLVSIPVQSYTAAEPGEGEIHFHQLHRPCHSRIKYVKTCPLHGPVGNDEIVSGFEYAKGQYVEFERDELDGSRAKSD